MTDQFALDYDSNEIGRKSRFYNNAQLNNAPEVRTIINEISNSPDYIRLVHFFTKDYSDNNVITLITLMNQMVGLNM